MSASLRHATFLGSSASTRATPPPACSASSAPSAPTLVHSPPALFLAQSLSVWFWNLISPVAWKVLSILAGLLSLALVYSELIIVVPGFAQYSVFALLVTLGLNDGFLLQLFCLLCIAYIALCAYVSLFKLKLFSFYQLLPHQRTDANSILFSAGLLSSCYLLLLSSV